VLKIILPQCKWQKNEEAYLISSVGERGVFKHENKEKEIERHFGEVLCTKRPRQLSLNWGH
jgi:hypothetical protein